MFSDLSVGKTCGRRLQSRKLKPNAGRGKTNPGIRGKTDRGSLTHTLVHSCRSWCSPPAPIRPPHKMTTPAAPAPVLKESLDSARNAIVQLLDAGIPDTDSRIETLISILARGHQLLRKREAKADDVLPDASLPANVGREPRNEPKDVIPPANVYDGFPDEMAPVGTAVRGSSQFTFQEENQRILAASRLIMDDAFTEKDMFDKRSKPDELPSFSLDSSVQPTPSSPRQDIDEIHSIFQAAKSLHVDSTGKRNGGKKKDPKSPTRFMPTRNASARLPSSPKLRRATTPFPPEGLDFSQQMCADITAEHAFQIKAQVEAYRRLVREIEIPAEVNIAALGNGQIAAQPSSGSVVERGVGDEGIAPSRKPVLHPNGKSRFDPRRLPRFSREHTFSKEDVVQDMEDGVSEEEIADRLQVAQIHHDRLHSRFLAVPSENLSDKVPGLDPRVRQRHAGILKKLQTIGSEDHIGTGETLPNTKSASEREKPLRRERTPPVIDESATRNHAAVPISVITKGAYAPSYGELVADREKRLQTRILSRLHEISLIKNGASEDLKRALTIEEKQLKLVGLQRTLRSRVMTCMRNVLDRRGASDLRPQRVARLKRRAGPYVFNAVAHQATYSSNPRIEMSYRAQQQAQRRARRANLMQNLMNHAVHFRSASHSRTTLRKRLLKDLERYFRDRSREEERRKKKQQMERLRALRNNNEDEYLELLKTTKNKRLIQLLKQTDEYLMQIGAQVERQKQRARDEDSMANGGAKSKAAEKKGGELAEEAGSDGDDEEEDELSQLKKRRNDYYTITHTISEKVHQPHILVGGKLKPYQVEGLEWLVSLFNNNLNGILADEMGLGKTIQTLALITYLIEVKKVSGPFLVIVPLSVISNWVRELDQWAPTVIKVVYKGDPTTRKNIHLFEMQGGHFNVVLTTYEFVVKDKHVLGRIRWKYIIMDEGHRMKNADCKLALTLGARYSSRNRLLLTGTPLQNNMTELWALLNFLLPTIFSSADTFETWFNAPFQESILGESAELNEEENLLIISRLHQVLRPFMLRRLKIDVETQLPDKVEIVFRCEMSVWQRVLDRQMRARIGIAAGSGNGGVRAFNNMVMQLKKICNHPYLFYSEEELMSLPTDFLVRAAGKFELLDHCLRKLKKSGHRVLMFSQMTAALDYLEYFLTNIGMKYLRLDGTTKADDRQEMLEMFNAEDSQYFCFLLSTRAGGLGLNLQTADTVIIFDSDWNPMMDLQAQDRAHRIGQTREVRVFRLICSGSIEVKILERASRKLQIDAQVIQAGQFNNKSSDNDRQEMLKDLLRHQNEDERRNEDATPSTEINRLLARSEEEFELFEEIDTQLRMEANGKSRLLEDESELPEWVFKPEQNAKLKKHTEEEYMLEHGRGRRKRKEVFYDDNLTEREWAAAMEEEGDIVEAVKRKRRRLATSQPTVVDASSDEANGQLTSSSGKESTEKDRDVESKKDSFGDVVEVESSMNGRTSSQANGSSSSKQTPFVDPDIEKSPKPKRKRGRPRKKRRSL